MGKYSQNLLDETKNYHFRTNKNPYKKGRSEPLDSLRPVLRRGRDSNPRYPFRHDSFQDCSIQPL